MKSVDAGSVDYLIVGSGVAGLYAAICLAPHGRVAVLSKQDLVAGNTWFAQGGIAAALDKEDSPEIHLEDTWQAGGCFGDRAAIKVLVEEAADRIQDLLAMGVRFDRQNGSIELGQEGAHSRKRILHIGGDATGRELVEALLQRARHRGVQFLEDAFAEELIIEEGSCRGVCFTWQGRRIAMAAGAVILATGGCGQLFQYTTNSPAVTGDGLAMAYRAGAALRDLEFFQFHPTVFYPPGGNPFLISEAVRGEGARLVNGFGEPFMERYHPRGELGPRDVVSRAILAERHRTGQEVYLDLRHLGEAFIRRRFPTIHQQCLKWGLNISRDLIPVSPAAHYMIGGVAVDLEGRTAVPGLYAVGEVASTGVHGANRLASNSLLEGLVFGYRVARGAVRDFSGPPSRPLRPQRSDFAGAAQEKDCLELRPQLQELMWETAGPVRSAAGLERARERLRQWWPLAALRYRHAKTQETANMLLLAAMMAESAYRRRESRGTHFREDFPDPDPAWAARHLVFQAGEAGQPSYPVPRVTS